MKLNKMAALSRPSPKLKTSTFSRGYGIDLTHAQGVQKLKIRATSAFGPVSGEPYMTSFFGEATEDGRYTFPIHCHGENILGGEEFAAAVLKAAENNTSVQASLEGSVLTFSSTATVPLLAVGRVRGQHAEVFTAMFSLSAPENSGSSLNSGLSFTYSYGSQSITYSEAYAGETVEFLVHSNSTRQLVGLSLVSTGGLPRRIDLTTFGIFRGTVSKDVFAPYWGEMTSFALAAPLRTFKTVYDYAYPLQGYAERWVKASPFRPDQIAALDLESSYPIYSVPIPERLWNTEVNLSRFYQAAKQSSLTSYSLYYMRSPDKTAFWLTGTSSHNTAEKFLAYFHSLNVDLIEPLSEPVIERFPPITLPTRKGRNYIDLQTTLPPGSIEFTYL